MRVKKLASMVVLFLLLGGQGMIVANQAYAACCACGHKCKRNCTCPGKGNCDWCMAPNPAEDPMLDEKIKGVGESFLASTATITNRFAASVRGIGGKFDLKVLDNVEDGLKFGCPESDDKDIQGNIIFALADTRQ